MLLKYIPHSQINPSSIAKLSLTVNVHVPFTGHPTKDGKYDSSGSYKPGTTITPADGPDAATVLYPFTKAGIALFKLEKQYCSQTPTFPVLLSNAPPRKSFPPPKPPGNNPPAVIELLKILTLSPVGQVSFISKSPKKECSILTHIFSISLGF